MLDNIWKDTLFSCTFVLQVQPSEIFPFAWQTQLYTEDWIGLKTLDDAGKVKYVKVAGNHLQISSRDMKKHVVPYLAGNASTDGSFSNVQRMVALHDLQDDASSVFTFEGSSSYKWPEPVNTFFAELLGLTIDQRSIDAWFGCLIVDDHDIQLHWNILWLGFDWKLYVVLLTLYVPKYSNSCKKDVLISDSVVSNYAA